MMKRTCIYLALALMTCAAALPVKAQDAPRPKELREIPSPEKTARRIANEMKKALQLSDKQYDKVYTLYYKAEKKLMQDKKPSGMRPPMHEGMDRRPPMGDGPMGRHPGEIGKREHMPPHGKLSPEEAEEARLKAEKQRAKSQQNIEKKLKKILSKQQYQLWQEHTLLKEKPGQQPPSPKKKAPDKKPAGPVI